MIYELQMLNTDATLNNFFDIGNARFVPNQPLKLVMRILQPEKNGLRYVPDSGATFSITFKNSDNTTFTKTPTVLDAGDRSIVEVSLTASETELLIGQNLTLEIDEAGETSVALLQMALKSAKAESC